MKMNSDREGLESAVDSLPDGPDKNKALAVLVELRQLERDGRLSNPSASGLGSSTVDLVTFFILFCAIACFFIVSLYRGRFPHLFLALFLGAFALIFLGIALGFGYTRFEIRFRRTSAFTRRMRARQKELAKENQS
jgi:hypothetical protein